VAVQSIGGLEDRLAVRISLSTCYASAMGAVATADPAWIPRVVRVASKHGLTSVSLGLAAGGLLLALFLGVEWALGRLALVGQADTPAHFYEDFRIAVILILFASYTPAAQLSALRMARRIVGELRPVLSCTHAEFEALLRATDRMDARRYRRACLVGLGLGISVFFVTDLSLDAQDLRSTPPEAIAHRILVPIVGWLAGGSTYSALVISRRFSSLGRELVRVDLLDPGSLQPFARVGLQMALTSLGFVSIGSLLLGDLEAAPALAEILAALLVFSVAMAVAGLLLPVLGIHERIRQEKRQEIRRCQERLRELVSGWETRAGGGAGSGPGVADVVAYRSTIEAVPEWPFNTPALTRFLLYLAIPLGSWTAGALVERLVDRALG